VGTLIIWGLTGFKFKAPGQIYQINPVSAQIGVAV